MTDRYQIISPIGPCGCGTVSRGWDSSQSRGVLVTRYPIQGPALQEFTQNARKLYVLRHANVGLVYDSGTDDEGGYLITEIIKGESLEKRVAQGPLSEADFVQLARQTLEGLAAAHGAGLLHLNLQPENLTLPWNSSNAFQVKITNFNLAPSAASQDASQHAAHFMAPEQFGKAYVDLRTDLYALGTVLYYALTQQHPFEGVDSSQVIVSHLYHRMVPLASLRPDLPPSMCGWVERLMSQDLKERPANAGEALRIFNAIVQQEAAVSAVSATPIMEEDDVPVLLQTDTEEDEDEVGAAAVAVDSEEDDGEEIAMLAPEAQLEREPVAEHSLDHLTRSAPVQLPLHRDLPRRKISALTFIIATFVIAAVGMLAFVSYVKFSQRGERQQRFIDLTKSEHPLGSDLDVRILFDYLNDPTTRKAAATVLTKLQGGDYIDPMIIDHLREIRGNTACAKLVEVIGNRKITSAFPEVLPLVHDHLNEVQKAAWTTLGKITQLNNLPQLIEGIRHSGKGEADHIEKSINAAIDNIKDRNQAIQVVQKAYQDPGGDEASRALLLKVLVHFGGPGALEIITAAIADPAPSVRRTAAEELTGYPTHDPLAAISTRFPLEPDAACRLFLIMAASGLIDKPGPYTQEVLARQIQSLQANAKTPEEKERIEEITDVTSAAKLAKTIPIAPSSTTTLLPVAGGDYYPNGEMARDEGILFNWKSERDWVSWYIQIPKNGEYEVTVQQAHAGALLGTYEILLAGQTLLTSVVKTADALDFQSFIVGKVTVNEPGTYKLLLRPKTLPAEGDLFRLQSVGLKLPQP